MDMRLEVVVLPVSDVDRAKNFYLNLGWRLDADFPGDAGFRVVQVTPPGSPCSVIFGAQVTAATPGSSADLMLVVTDIEAARAELAGRGVDVSEVYHDAGGVFHHAGTDAPGAGPRSAAPFVLVVRVVQRPGRQRLGAARNRHPAPGAVTGDGRRRPWPAC